MRKSIRIESIVLTACIAATNLGEGLTRLCLAQSTLPKFKRDYPLTEAPMEAVQINDNFWYPRLERNRTVSPWHHLEQNEARGAMPKMRLLAGSKEPDRRLRFLWEDSDLYKSMEGILRIQRTNKDKELHDKLGKEMEKLIDLIAAVQEKDGYLFPHYQLYKKDYRHFSDENNSCETYSMGHLIELGVEHYQVTGKKKGLEIAKRAADCIDAYFGAEAEKHDLPAGHSEIELALIRLYRATRDSNYLKLAGHFVHKTKTIPNKWTQYNPDTSKSYVWYRMSDEDRAKHALRKPALADTEARGHGVAMFYLYSGAVDVAQLTGDKELMDLMCKKWDNVALRKTYITGNCAHKHQAEGFSDEYHLPNDLAYCETCTGISYVLWNYRLFLATGDAKYINMMERTLYNAFLSAVGISGKHVTYENPLYTAKTTSRTRGNERVAWPHIACCPPNVIRFFPLIPSYIYSTSDKTDDVYVNLFVANETQLDLHGRTLKLTQKTKYPEKGCICIDYHILDSGQTKEKETEPFRIRVRVPDWCKNSEWTFNQTSVKPTVEKGYAVFTCDTSKGQIVLNCPMPVVRMEAHPKVVDDRGRVALMRGPIVYCFEGPDNPDLGDPVNFILAKEQQYKIMPKVITPGLEVTSIIAKDSSGRSITAIPYFPRIFRKLNSKI